MFNRERTGQLYGLPFRISCKSYLLHSHHIKIERWKISEFLHFNTVPRR